MVLIRSWPPPLLLPVLAAGLLAAFLLGAPAGQARVLDGTVEPGEHANRFDGGERFTLYWETAGDRVHLALEARTGGWAAVGLDPVRAMDRADMLLGMVRGDGTVTVSDAFSTGPSGPHPPDTALGAEDDFSAPHRDRGSGVPAAGFPGAAPAEGEALSAPGGAAAAPPVPYRAALLTHAWLMTAAALLMGVAMLIPRYLKKNRWWLRAHRTLGVAGPCLGVLGAAAAVYLVGISTGVYLGVVHAWAGSAAAAGFIATPLLCRYLFSAPKEKKKPLRASHRWAGRAALLLMLGALVLGLFRAGFL
jgi:hypothetical protein